MKALDIVKSLMAQGYNIEFTIRADGGIRVKSVNGQRFTASEGNRYVRELTGKRLSEKQIAQRLGSKKQKKYFKQQSVLRKGVKSQIRKAQRIWNKNKTQADKSRISTKRIRKVIERYGEEEAMESLEKSMKYSQGYAYEENVYHLIDRLFSLTYVDTTLRIVMTDIVNQIDDMKNRFKDEWIEQINELAYKFDNKQISGEELVSKIKEIIKE